MMRPRELRCDFLAVGGGLGGVAAAKAAGSLAAYCLEHACVPQQVHEQTRLLGEFQQRLMKEGVELAWPRGASLPVG